MYNENITLVITFAKFRHIFNLFNRILTMDFMVVFNCQLIFRQGITDFFIPEKEDLMRSLFR